LSFVTFGFATAEFEVTEERLGCYRPEEHIDNPKVAKTGPYSLELMDFEKLTIVTFYAGLC
jgi:hypothetical protein